MYARTLRASRTLASASAVWLIAAAVPAQDAAVYATNAKNGRIMRLSFDSATSVAVNTDSPSSALGLVARDDGGGAIHLIMCDNAAGRVLFYANSVGGGQTITSQIPSPDGPSVTPAGTLYLVSTGSNRAPGQVWRVPRTNCAGCAGGYGAPVVVDQRPGVRLEDTEVAPFTEGSLTSGDLLVLAGSPPQVLRYPGGAAPAQTFIPTSRFPARAEAMGMTFTPGHELLITTLSGPVLRFDASGNRLSPDFRSGIGNGRFKIDAGMQGGEARAFVASRSGGRVLRFRIQPDGTGVADGMVTAGVQQPNAVCVTTGPSVTPKGTGVTVNPAPEVSITFEDVTKAGFTSAKVLAFADNRVEPCATQNLKDFFPAGSPERAELPDVAVPCYVRGFPTLLPTDDPGHPTGPETFLLAVIDNTAEFAGVAEFHGHEEERFGYQPACPNAVLEQEPHTFYSPEQPRGEPSILEAEEATDCPFPRIDSDGASLCPIFADVSSQCGSNKGSGWNFSLYLTARDTRPLADIIHAKLWLIHDTLWHHTDLVADPYPLDTLIHEAIDASVVDVLDSSLRLGQFITTARAAAIDNTTRNLTGELVARAISAKFFVCKTAPDFAACLALK